jgi:diguanylate cyclase (GGDEF)-like protein
MAQPGESSQPQPSSEESFLELLVETLSNLDDSVRGPFLREFFRTVAQVELTETESIENWRSILQRRSELAASGRKAVALKAAMIDVLASKNLLRVPIMMEYADFKKLQINAATDSLTGLYNRRLFDEHFEKELNRAKRYGHQLAVVILDLHRLKEVNDQYGHLQGDRIIQLAADTLRKTLRSSDFAFRIGGDELALLLPQTDSDQAITLCRRVRAQYEADVRPLKLDIAVTIDFGLAVSPEDGDKQTELLETADKRLYQLKVGSRSPSRPVAEEASHGRETEQSAEPPGSGPQPSMPAKSQPEPAAPHRAEKRKWERVSLSGTKAYAVISDVAQKTARVVDLSYGGVSLIVEKPDEIAHQFSAVLHVPILPPVRVVLRKSYTLTAKEGRARVGCSFVS